MPEPAAIVNSHRREAIGISSEFCSSAANEFVEPGRLAASAPDWMPGTCPGTVAAALFDLGKWSPAEPYGHIDGRDWWYRTEFTAERGLDEQAWLCCDGLATVADVWLNGSLVLSSASMFQAHERRVDGLLADVNRLLIRFRAMTSLLAVKRPRPRWRAPMVEHQQLRWYRTTLLGRTPGWSPPAPVIGPWRPMRLEYRRRVAIEALRFQTHLDGPPGRPGRYTGLFSLSCRLPVLDEAFAIASATLVLTRNGQTFSGSLERTTPGDGFIGCVEVVDVEPWWPHTHGNPALYEAGIHVLSAVPGDQPIVIGIGEVGFRRVELDVSAGRFALSVNGIAVFCRGACWTPLDPISFSTRRESQEAAMKQVCDAGMNMLRVSGPMVYEDRGFLDLCDRYGILLWQDFMFANMDYPGEDPSFKESVLEEVAQQLSGFQGRPCLALLCGNSEVEQQAAMFGAERGIWRSDLFDLLVPEAVREWLPGLPYWPSSAHGGAFPHQCNIGSTSYYGVGAYRRPLEDARRSEVRFASECLAFANIPEDANLKSMPGGLGLRVHHPGWKSRTPRDLGAGWDFDDVRDHYLQQLFQVDPNELRYVDHERYIDLGRVVSGEVMAEVFQEWRRKRSTCDGGLVWFLRDLWPGAGWGVIDSSGQPKAAYYYLSRSLQPLTLFLSDEGVNGLFVHLVNDRPAEVETQLDIALYRGGETLVERATRDVRLPASDSVEIPLVGLFDRFMDLSHAYRFGRPGVDLVVATLLDASGSMLGQAFHFPIGRPAQQEVQIGLQANASERADGCFDLRISTSRMAQAVNIQAPGFCPSDNYFHIPPLSSRQIVLTRKASLGPLKGNVRALNAEASVRIDV